MILDRFDLPGIVQHDFNAMFIGELIAKGSFRTVYEYRPNPKWVIKFDEGKSQTFCNQIEWNVWNYLQNTKWAKYLAPCISISDSGNVLLMERTSPIEKMPSKLPNFLADLKINNFGKLNGKVVCHDYGNNDIIYRALKQIQICEIKPNKPNSKFPHHYTFS